ncbi:MAG: hypothetical protein VX955_09715 [Pseudomonadota bacterium]|nr:hypothetical protein [Pseudomonadota bacterium]
MPRFYTPDLGDERESPFARDGDNKLVRRSFWLDISDRSVVMAPTRGIGVHLTNDQKRAYLADIRREHLIDAICIQEILPPARRAVYCRGRIYAYAAPLETGNRRGTET